jgi:hypothetical protein
MKEKNDIKYSEVSRKRKTHNAKEFNFFSYFLSSMDASDQHLRGKVSS